MSLHYNFIIFLLAINLSAIISGCITDERILVEDTFFVSQDSIPPEEGDREEIGIDFAFDAKFAQIGIRWGIGPQREWENRPWLRSGLPVWIDAGVDEKDSANGLVLSPFDVAGGVNGVGFSIFSLEVIGNGVILSPFFSVVGELNGLNFGLMNFCADGYSVQLGAVNWRELWGRL